MDAAELGVWVGRFLFSYLLVAIIYLLINKFKFAAAFKKLHTLKGLLIILAVFVLPILASVGGRV